MAEIHTAYQQPERRHQHIVDQRANHLAESRADDDADGEIDHVAAGDEVAKLFGYSHRGIMARMLSPPPPMMTKQVKPGLYMVINGGGNSTFRVTDQGVILVDTKNLGDQFYNDLMAQIKTVTTQPVKYVFITHVHQDHSGNIGKFVQAGAQVIPMKV